MGACLAALRYFTALFLRSCQATYEGVVARWKRRHRPTTSEERLGVLYFGAPDQRLSEEDDDLHVDLDDDDDDGKSDTHENEEN